METVSNVATAAAKAVWGDGDANKEPISGAQGDTTRGEPYDAGNMGMPSHDLASLRSEEHTSELQSQD